MWRDIEQVNVVEEILRYTFSRNRNLRRRLLVGIGDRWAGNDDGENAVLHVRDNLLSLFSSSERQRKEQREEKANCGIARNSHGSIKLAELPLFDGEADIREHGL